MTDDRVGAAGDGDFAGSRILVTGASRGIGAAVLRRFAAAGATVIGTARHRPDDELPGDFIPADLGTATGATDLADRVRTAVGGVDVLVDNAGASTPPTGLLERSDEDWTVDLAANLLSAVRLDRALVPGMVARGHGVVVHVSSVASKLGQPGQAPYAAAKAALNIYSRALAVEVGPHGVRVVNVLPGFVATPGALAYHQSIADQRGVSLEQAQGDLAASLDVPMRRPGTAEEAADLIVFLASTRAGWLTGAQYRVDGGLLADI